MRDYTVLLDKFPYAGIFIVLILGGFGLPFPEDIVLIITGASIATGAISLGPAILAAFPALLMADILLYSSGKKYGRALIEKGRLQKIVSRERLQKLESGFQKNGVYYILFGRPVAGLRAQLFLMAGVTGMPLGKFVIADFMGALIGFTIMVSIGYLGGNSLQVILKDISRIEHVAVVTVVAAVAAWITVRFYRSRSWRLRQYLDENGKGQH